MKQSPRNTALGPLGSYDIPLYKVTQLEVGSLYLSLKIKIWSRFPWERNSKFSTYVRPKRREKNRFQEHVKTTDFSCVTCKEVRLICSEGIKRCFEGFVSSRNSLLINFDRYQDFGAILATVRTKSSGRFLWNLTISTSPIACLFKCVPTCLYH